MGLLDLCEKYFGQRDIYKLLELEKFALAKNIKKAYYKLSLQVHPDRVKDEEKPLATEKFKVLSKVYQVLSDKEKRDLYDEQGIIEEEDDMECKLNSWLELWRKIFKPLTIEDISNYEKSYIDSELERTDMKKAYLAGKGCINYMMNEVPFLNVDSEPRMQKIIRGMIDSGEVPEYSLFTDEPSQKRQRRHKKFERESKEADEIKKKMQNDKSLQKQILERQKARENNFDSYMDRLVQKYGNGEQDDSDIIDIRSMTKLKKGSSQKKANGTPKTKGVKKGRVQKKQK